MAQRLRCQWLGVFALLVFGLGAPTQSLANDELVGLVKLGEPPERAFDLERFQVLISQGADVNSRDESGQSVLLLTTIAHAYLPDTAPDKPKLFKALQELVAHRADPNVASNVGATSLMMAVHRAHSGAVEGGHPVPDIAPVMDLLLKAPQGADVSLRNAQGQTVAFYLARWREFNLLKRFATLGSLIDDVDNDGNSILMSAAAAGVAPLEELLAILPVIERRPALLRRSNAGSDALIFAVRAARLEAVRFLLERYQFPVNAVNSGGESALSIAEMRLRLPRLSSKDAKKFRQIVEILNQARAVRPRLPSPNRVYCDRGNAEPFGFAELKRVIQACGVTQVDQLIRLLPDGHRANYLLAYQGRGIQQSSAAFPRVITMGSTQLSGKRIAFFSFTGDPALSGYSGIELLEYFPATSHAPAHFELREVQFQSGRPSFSSANPARCTECHGAAARPQWDSWYLWPGFYRSEQGALYPTERRYYANYLKNRHQGRYAPLLELADSPLYLRDGIFADADLVKNVQFDSLVQDLNAETIAGEIAGKSARGQPLGRFKYAVLAAVSCFEPMEGFLPEAWRGRMPRAESDLLRETQALDVEEMQRRVARQVEILQGPAEGSYSQDFQKGLIPYGQSQNTVIVSRLRYLLEGIGESMKWSMTFERDRTRYSLPGLWALELKLPRLLLSQTNPREAGIRAQYERKISALPTNLSQVFGVFRGADFFRSTPDADGVRVCRDLRRLSLQALAKP